MSLIPNKRGFWLLRILYWYNSERRLWRFIKRWLKDEPSSTSSGNNPVGIVICTWFMNTVPWFSVALGLLLAKKNRDVVFIIDDMPFGSPLTEVKIQLGSIRRIAKLLSCRYKVVYVSDFFDKANFKKSKYEQVVSKLARLNAIHDLKAETKLDTDKGYQELVKKQLARIYYAAWNMFENMSFDYLVLPGGISSSSGIYLDLAKQKKLRAVTYDSDVGSLVISTDGIATQVQDLPRLFEKLRVDREFEDISIHEAAIELKKRQTGSDTLSFQACPSNENSVATDKKSVLIPLNIGWDGAALGIFTFYEGSIDYLVDTVRWILQNSEHQIIVRQHPLERHEVYKSLDDFRSLLAREFPGNERIKFISADMAVNSYDLIKQVQFVVVSTSTLGIEASMLGKPVITPTNVYYSSLGFVFKASTRQEYLDLLRSAVRGELTVSEEMKRDAHKCYFLTQICNWFFTKFSPVSHYKEWIGLEPEDLWGQEDVQLVLASIDENIPLPFLIYQRKLESEKKLT